jgi:hypothetical protein
VSRSALYYHAKRDGWTYRVAMADGPDRRRVRQKDLGQRLMDALDRKLTEFEHRLDAGAPGLPPTAADAERDARTLNTLVRLFHRLETLGGMPAGAVKAAAAVAPGQREDNDADRLRHALAQRLETLRLSLAD